MITDLEQSLKDFEDKGKAKQEEYSSQATNYINTLEDYKNQAAKILNIISNTSMAGGYKQEADREGQSRKFWRTATMISMICLIIASVWSFTHPFGDGSIWTEIARRVFVAATFATVAGYSARQAKIHLDAERLYRRMELELTSLNPYLLELEDTKRQDILAKMAEQFFGRNNVDLVQTNTTQKNQEVSGNLTELSKLLESAQSLLNIKK